MLLIFLTYYWFLHFHLSSVSINNEALVFISAFDMTQIEKEAALTAAKHVANMLQRPDQLEKVDKYMHRELRKKVGNFKCFVNYQCYINLKGYNKILIIWHSSI